VLELGRLSYFEKEHPSGDPPYGSHFLKSVVLRNVALSHHDDPCMICLQDRLDKSDLFIKADSVQMAETWRKVCLT
jgi:hypothetical protein